MDVVSFSKFCLRISFWLFELEWILSKSVLKSEKHIFSVGIWFSNESAGSVKSDRQSRWVKDECETTKSHRLSNKNIWNQFGRKSHQMEGQCKATKSNADCFAEDLKPVSEKKSQNGDECRKKQMFSHWSSFSHWSLSAFYINQGRKGRSQNFESMQWHLGIIFIRYL